MNINNTHKIFEQKIKHFQVRMKHFAFTREKTETTEEWVIISFEYPQGNTNVDPVEAVLEGIPCTYIVEIYLTTFVLVNGFKRFSKQEKLEALPSFSNIPDLIDYLMEMNVNPDNIRASV